MKNITVNDGLEKHALTVVSDKGLLTSLMGIFLRCYMQQACEKIIYFVFSEEFVKRAYPEDHLTKN